MSSVIASERRTCRVCGNSDLSPVLSLGALAVSGFPEGPASSAPGAAGDDAVKAPLDVVMCNPGNKGCGLVQLKHSVSPELMYRHYWYRSVTNESMRKALADVTARAEHTVDVRSGDIVLDIGCNDGTLLRSYRAPGARLCGFEPAKNLVVFARQGTHLVINDFFNAAAFHGAFGADRAKVITTIAMFYDLEEPNTFVADIAACLHDDGVWINQMASLPLMLESNGFDNICHEHLEYYSLAVLVALYARHGLEVFDVETNDVNGGSFRVFARKRGARVGESPFAHARVAAMLHYEQALGLGTAAPYQAFTARVQQQRDELVALLRRERSAGKRIYGYGASTKGNTLLQYDAIGPDLVQAIAERNPEKWGRRTVASNIPIISEEQARADKPDYFLVFPWHFLSAFREREKDYLASGGRFIVPLPTTRIVAW